MTPTVRRIAAHEWDRVKAFRIEAVSDPAAGIAFLSTLEEESSRSNSSWQERATAAASSDSSAQFVAVDERDAWLGTATALRRRTGETDHLGRPVAADRVDIVGVYVRPDARGRHLVDLLVDEIARWAGLLGATSLTLDVHRDNARARAAYVRAGFTPTGVQFTGPIGPELELSRPLS